MLSFLVLRLLALHQGSVLDLLGGLQCSADPLLISSCFWHEKKPLAFYKLDLEHKNNGMKKCLEKPLHVIVVVDISSTFFRFLKILLFWAKNDPKLPISFCHALYLRNCRSYHQDLIFLVHRSKIISFFKKYKILTFFIGPLQQFF